MTDPDHAAYTSLSRLLHDGEETRLFDMAGWIDADPRQDGSQAAYLLLYPHEPATEPASVVSEKMTELADVLGLLPGSSPLSILDGGSQPAKPIVDVRTAGERMWLFFHATSREEGTVPTGWTERAHERGQVLLILDPDTGFTNTSESDRDRYLDRRKQHLRTARVPVAPN